MKNGEMPEISASAIRTPYTYSAERALIVT